MGAGEGMAARRMDRLEGEALVGYSGLALDTDQYRLLWF